MFCENVLQTGGPNCKWEKTRFFILFLRVNPNQIIKYPFFYDSHQVLLGEKSSKCVLSLQNLKKSIWLGFPLWSIKKNRFFLFFGITEPAVKRSHAHNMRDACSIFDFSSRSLASQLEKSKRHQFRNMARPKILVESVVSRIAHWMCALRDARSDLSELRAFRQGAQLRSTRRGWRGSPGWWSKLHQIRQIPP